MLTYQFCFFVFVIAAYFWPRFDRHLQKISTVALFFLLVLLIGFKYDVGTDSVNYLNIYKGYIYRLTYSSDLPLSFPEFNYSLLNIASIYIGGGMLFVYVIGAILISYGTVRAPLALSLNPFKFLALIFPAHIVMLSLSGIRQGIAESLVGLAFALLLSSQRVMSFLLILLASTFHSSALLFVSIFCIYLKQRWIFVISPILLILLLYYSMAEYEQYLTVEMSSIGVVLRFGLYICLCVAILLVYRSNKHLFDSIETRMLTYFLAFGVATAAVTIVSSTLADRISFYLIILASLFFLYVEKKALLNKQILFLSYALILGAYVTLFGFSFFGNHVSNYSYDNYIYRFIVDGEFPKIDSRNKVRGGYLPGSGEPY